MKEEIRMTKTTVIIVSVAIREIVKITGHEIVHLTVDGTILAIAIEITRMTVTAIIQMKISKTLAAIAITVLTVILTMVNVVIR